MILRWANIFKTVKQEDLQASLRDWTGKYRDFMLTYLLNTLMYIRDGNEYPSTRVLC
jgi:hypothetical protein